MPLMADGFSGVDSEFLRNAMIFLAAGAAFALCLKQLFWPAKTMAQPLIVALEKEFVTQKQHEKDHTELHRYVKNVDAYAHEESHEIRGILHAASLHQQERNERLARLEADSKTHTNQLRDLNTKADNIVREVGNKVEQLIRDGVIRGGRA